MYLCCVLIVFFSPGRLILFGMSDPAVLI